MIKDSFEIESKDKSMYTWITIVSILVPVVVAVLLFMPAKIDLGEEWVYFLPHLNAVVNSFASVMLILGFFFIKSGNVTLHKTAMSVAFGLELFF